MSPLSSTTCGTSYDELSPPSVKQHLAALSHAVDWLDRRRYGNKSGPCCPWPTLHFQERQDPNFEGRRGPCAAREHPVTKRRGNDPEGTNQPDLLGLRDRALIAIMVYSFARMSAVIQMKVGDYFVQGRRRWVRLHETGGKEHDVPSHHRLDHCLHDYIEAAGIADDSDGYDD
jgi:hypothetical protein